MNAKLLSKLGIEVWKNIPEFESYQVSNLGNARSLNYGKERIIKQMIGGRGYYRLYLRKNKKSHTPLVSQLMAIAFLNHKPCGNKIVVDHIDNNKLNNKLYNLQLITNRENTSKDRKNGSSKYIGVSWCNTYKKWVASIRIKGKQKQIGYFTDEKEASQAYQNELKKL